MPNVQPVLSGLLLLYLLNLLYILCFIGLRLQGILLCPFNGTAS